MHYRIKDRDDIVIETFKQFQTYRNPQTLSHKKSVLVAMVKRSSEQSCLWTILILNNPAFSNY